MLTIQIGLQALTNSVPKTHETPAVSVNCSSEYLTVYLEDGRIVSAPLSWYPRLVHATQGERDNAVLEGYGDSIHWPDLDEDLSIEGILYGRRSGESEKSFNRWLRAKKEGRGLTLYELAAYEESQKQQLSEAE